MGKRNGSFPDFGATHSNSLSCYRKGLIEVDFIVAIGFFIFIFAAVAFVTTNYITNVESTSRIEELTAEALTMMAVAERGSVPEGWDGTGGIERMGLATRAYRFYIVVNNSQGHYINQSDNASALVNEIVRFNYSEMWTGSIDLNSTYITDGTNDISYQADGSNVSFVTDVSLGQVKVFTVYFDDDSSFPSRSVSVSGSNKIREAALAVTPVSVVQYKKIIALNSSSYSAVRNSTSVNEFHITLQDEKKKNVVMLSYGGEEPRRENVIVVQRYVVYQNASAGISRGKMLVRMW